MTGLKEILNVLTIMKDNDSAHMDQPGSSDSGNTEESIPMLLATCMKHIRASLSARFVEAGSSISFEQWRVITLLTHQDGVSQLDLAQLSDRTEVSTFNLLKKLESGGYVLRQKDPVDARCKRVFLTAAGRRKQQELLPVVLDNRARICNGLNEEDIKTLKQTLKIIIENIKQP